MLYKCDRCVRSSSCFAMNIQRSGFFELFHHSTVKLWQFPKASKTYQPHFKKIPSTAVKGGFLLRHESGRCIHPYEGAVDPRPITDVILHSDCNQDRMALTWIEDHVSECFKMICAALLFVHWLHWHWFHLVSKYVESSNLWGAIAKSPRGTT